MKQNYVIYYWIRLTIAPFLLVLICNVNFQVQNIDVPIGRVYVDDLDDWDLSDKKFLWETKDHQRFKLDEETGELTMRTGTPRGNYELQFRVMDRKHKQNNVEARVRVRVKDLSYNTITNSGSLRLSGISAVELMVSL